MTAAQAVTAPSSRPRPLYTSIGSLGLVLAGLAPLVLTVAGLALGFRGEEIVYPLVGTLVAFAGAALVWRFGRWATVLGIVIAVLLALAFFWIAFGLAVPASPVDFVPAVLLPTGVVLALAGNVAALVDSRRGRLVIAASRGERATLAGAAAVVVVAVVMSGALWVAARSSVPATAGATDVNLERFSFQPEAYEIAAGEEVTFRIHNADPVTHTFTNRELGLDTTVLPGNDALVTFTPERAGTYTLYCVPHSSGPNADPANGGEMAATLTVR